MLSSKEINTIQRIKYLENKQTPNRANRRKMFFGMGNRSSVTNNRKRTPGRNVQIIGNKVVRHKIASAS